VLQKLISLLVNAVAAKATTFQSGGQVVGRRISAMEFLIRKWRDLGELCAKVGPKRVLLKSGHHAHLAPGFVVHSQSRLLCCMAVHVAIIHWLKPTMRQPQLDLRVTFKDTIIIRYNYSFKKL